MRIRYCELSCDDGSASDCWENSGPARTMAQAIKEAKASGWYVGKASDEADTCPACLKLRVGR